MAQKPVAVAADISVSPGFGLYPGAAKGKWKAGPVTISTYPKLTVAGAETAWEARCTFTFDGNAPPTAETPINGTSDVTLTATAKKFAGSGKYALVDGDRVQDEYGNTLSVNAAGKLRTS